MGNEDLRALLTSHQSTVYAICFQVLRSSADAEDAAQDALLEIVRGVNSIREPRAFKRWLCRTTLNTAIDHRRRRARRAKHEQARAAMTHDAPDPGLDSLHEALSNLDDDDRCLLVEKYFEGATLETMGAREGVSAAAVGKRIDRAKERLKRTLAMPELLVLESLGPVTHSPPLSLEPALAAASGGVFVGKALAVLIALIAVGGGYSLARRPTASIPKPVASKGIATFEEVPTAAVTHAPGESARPPAISELISRLARFRKWYDEFKPPQAEATFSMDDPEETRQKVRAELEGVRALIYKHPRVFIDWIAQAEHSRCVMDLVAATLGEKVEESGARLNGGFGVAPDDGSQNFRDFPSELTDGLLALLDSSNESVQDAVLRWATSLEDAPGEWRTRYLALAAHDNEEIRLRALRALLFTGKPAVHELRELVGLAGRSDDERSSQVLHELCRCANPDSRDQVLNGLEAGMISDAQGETASLVVQWVIMYDPMAGADFEERAGALLLSALRRARKESSYSEVVIGALQLSPRFAKPIVAKAAAEAPTDRLRVSAAGVLNQARMDEENWRTHRTLWISLMRTN